MLGPSGAPRRKIVINPVFPTSSTGKGNVPDDRVWQLKSSCLSTRLTSVALNLPYKIASPSIP